MPWNLAHRCIFINCRWMFTLGLPKYVYYNMFFLPFLVNIVFFCEGGTKNTFFSQPMMVTNQTTLQSQNTFFLKLKAFYLVHIVCTNLCWPKFDLGTRYSKKKSKNVKHLHIVFVWHLVFMKIMKLEMF